MKEVGKEKKKKRRRRRKMKICGGIGEKKN
jgi:hypothetical protein